MKKYIRKCISFLLVLALAAIFVPAAACAAEEEDTTVFLPPVARVAWVEEENAFANEYVTLEEAIDHARTVQGEVTVTLLEDTDESIYVDSGIFTLDLNGHTLTSVGHSYSLFVQNAGTEVVLTDSSDEKTGKIDAQNGIAVTVSDNAILTVQSGTFCGNYGAQVGSGGQNRPGTLIVEGGIFQGGINGIFVETDRGTVTVKGGSMSGQHAAIRTYSDVTVTGTPELTSASNALFECYKCKIDLSGASSSGWTVKNYANEDMIVGKDLLLPKDHCVYINGDLSTPVSVIAYCDMGVIHDHVHIDAKVDHRCDICGVGLTYCIDNDGNYVCDICGVDLERPTPEVPQCKKDANCILSKYTDINVADWYHDGIHFCVDGGLMNGMSATTFAPTEPTTRAQLVMMLYRLEGEPGIEGMTEPFADVAETDWYYAPIVWAYNHEVVNGVSAAEFSPNANVTREQVATILHRYLESPEGKGDLSTYPDVASVSVYAKDALVWAVGEGLINGVAQADGTSLLDPSGNATRAQIATILMRHLVAEG